MQDNQSHWNNFRRYVIVLSVIIVFYSYRMPLTILFFTGGDIPNNTTDTCYNDPKFDVSQVCVNNDEGGWSEK